MNILKIKQIVSIITICILASCKNDPTQLSEVKGTIIPITESYTAVDSIEAYVAPYRNRINAVLDSTLAIVPKDLVLDDGERNTSMGNLLVDILLKETRPLFLKQTDKELDFAVFNRGGIRSIISAGNVTARNAYEVMPFENFIAVVELDGKAMRNLIDYLINSSRVHPIAGMQIVLDKNGNLESVNVNGSPFDENRNYYVATSDYLVQGGPSIGFFNDMVSVHDTGYLVRNAIIDYFKKVDTVTANVDNRFIQRK
ncbi:5'-nucleotidase C-terminal domain-containing protein [Muricauda sp. 2012CJ35-5]|uniref:5'-nucleotidase C-terminal domain-containing protein n=1 Tax=Flagellimonas spongiicola TaxID=2942208 RepID=A0ABT0PNW7_9FLAO|nr:5'-nucleotidase [Allomuricauda spongiicola]MCL6273085.1 5'-nucleotidase C-terminal domain-containing protein [Allomuricauda spongiicola]